MSVAAPEPVVTGDLAALVERFAGLEVLVVGDVLLDSYLEGEGRGLCREAPVPVVGLTGRVDAPGGAANAAAALAALGAAVTLVSVTGDDDDGRRLRDVLVARGVATRHLIARPSRATPAKVRVAAGGQLLARLDSGSTEPIDERTEAVLAARLAALVPTAHAVVVSDYDHGVLSDGLVEALVVMRPEAAGVVVVDARSPSRWARLRPDAVKPNWDEARRLLGPLPSPAPSRVEVVQAGGDRILDATGARVAAVSLDDEGAVVLERGRPAHRTFATPAPHDRATGAGDTFVAALTMALATGASVVAAAELAAAAAVVVVAKDGTATCSVGELRAAVATKDKRRRVDDLAAEVAGARALGHRVVFTNGCFEVLHRGHVAYLHQAKALGDVLVVGVNDDAGVERLRGDGHPLSPLGDRMGVLAALSCVDHVVAFDGDTAESLIALVRPDVYVKGSDHRIDDLPEAPLVRALGGRVELVDYVTPWAPGDVFDGATAEP